MTLTDEAFAQHWGIPLYADAYADKRYASIATPSIDIIHAVKSALNSPHHRTRQLKKVAKMLIGLEALVNAYQHDPHARQKNRVSNTPPLAGEIEAKVAIGEGPKADTLQTVASFVGTMAASRPDRRDLLKAVELMNARSLISDHEAALAPMTFP